MVEIGGKKYYTAKELSGELGVAKTYICKLARTGKLRHTLTNLGYLFDSETIHEDWENRSDRKWSRLC